MIGQQISKILTGIEDTLWVFEANNGEKPEFTTDGLRASCKIFASAMMDKMWELQDSEDMDKETRINMAEQLGKDIRLLVKVYAGIDLHDLYI